MSKKISLGTALAIALVAVAAAVAVTMAVSMKVYNSMISDLPNRVSMYSKISDLDEIVRKNYYGDVDSDSVDASMAAGYIKGLGDENSVYMTSDEYIEYYNRIRGKMSGTGITWTFNEDTGYIHITGVAANTPAESAGLKTGDEIIKIGDDKVTKDNYESLAKKLTGESMSSINVTYRRNGTDTTVSVVIGYSQTTVTYRLIGSIGYISINAFYGNTQSQFEAALKDLKSQGAASIIFDVRNCTQGTVEYATAVLDDIVPLATEGTNAMATAIDKDGKTVKTFPSDSDSIVMPMIVLINRNTSGAAELFACDLRDFHKADLVGETTAGNGTMQQVFQFSDGSAVLLTTAKIVPYTSESFDGTGVKPDHVIKMTTEQTSQIGIMSDSKDPDIVKAIKLLS